MNKKFLFIVMILITIFFIFNCPMNNDDNNKKKKSKNNNTTLDDTSIIDDSSEETILDIPENQTTVTGSVAGTINAEATVTVTTTDFTDTTNTTPLNPDFIIDEVPVGEVTVTITTGDQTITQTVQINENETTNVNPFGSTTPIENSLTVQAYAMTGEKKSTNDFGSIIGDIFYSKEINIPIRKFNEGFPGIADTIEYFGIKYSGQIKAKTTGTYTFIVVSDDGSKLSVDGSQVTLTRIGSSDAYFQNAYTYALDPATIPGFPECDGSDSVVKNFAKSYYYTNSDSQHAPAIYKAIVNLTAGQTYAFELKYFQGPKYHIACVVKVDIPNEGIDGNKDGLKLFNMVDFE